MEKAVTGWGIHRYGPQSGIERFDDILISELLVKIVSDGRELGSSWCSPMHLDELAVGFLLTSGKITRADELTGIKVDEENQVVYVDLRTLDPRAEKSAEKKPQDVKIYAQDVLDLMKQLLQSSQLHRDTGGVHTVALGQGNQLLIYREDIGRHNAVDKVLGYCLLHGISIEDKVLVLSGRVSSEIMSKAIRMGVKCLVSRSAVTDEACRMAREQGITLLGFTRGARFNIYSGIDRIIVEEE